ncbi:MAG TPA: carboxypeptidase regulatory-like domain-containing protein, partial [Thermoanaerobaculia bacterium]|nr:carboxypeptidase regulatory-like domain-containing protein [Thermoanaerobaculia bacterium]
MRRTWLVWVLVLVTALPGLGALPVSGEPIPLRGQVVDADGKPLRGASVALLPVVSRFASQELLLQGKALPEPVARTASREDGRFEMSAPSPGMWEMQVTARGFVPRRFSLFPLLEPLEIPRLEMVQEAPLPIRVVDAQGRPVAGAQVRVNAGESPVFTPLSWWWPKPELVTTGTDGTATVSRWKGVEVELEAAAPGHPPAALKVAARESTAEMRLAAACPRTVQVSTRGRDGAARPVAGALAVHRSWPLGVTGEDGRVTVAAPCERDLGISVETRDGRQARATLRSQRAGRANRTVDPLTRVTLPAEPVRVSGRVLTEGSRAPVAGALVWTGADPAGFVRTDAQGAYTLTLTAGEPSHVTGDAVGHLADLEEVRAGEGPTFLLTPLAVASGVVVDEAGRPVTGARVRGMADDPAKSGLWNPLLSGSSDAKGEFRLRVLSSEALTLSASHPDFVAADLSIPPVAPHASRSGLRIVLAKGLAASGKVVDAEGRPIAGAEVWLFPSMDGDEGFAFFRQMERRLTPAVTDARGVFTLEHLKPGRMDLQASARGFAPTRVRGLQLTAGDGAVDLGTVTLGPGVTLAGVVVDPADRPVAGATVQLLGTASPLPVTLHRAGEEELLTAADGSFSIPGLAPEERVTLSISRKGFASADFRDLQVPPAEPLRIVLTPGSRIAGRLVDEQGDPVSGMVSLRRIGGQSTGGPIVDHAGTAE